MYTLIYSHDPAIASQHNTVEQHLVPIRWANKHLHLREDKNEKLVLPIDDVMQLLQGAGIAAKPLFRLAKIGLGVRLTISVSDSDEARPANPEPSHSLERVC